VVVVDVPDGFLGVEASERNRVDEVADQLHVVDEGDVSAPPDSDKPGTVVDVRDGKAVHVVVTGGDVVGGGYPVASVNDLGVYVDQLAVHDLPGA